MTDDTATQGKRRRRAGLTRRTVLRDALGTLAVTMGAVTMGADKAFAQAAAAAPNIIFIMADDLGFADLSCYGRPDISTPHIDGLAKKGVRFLQAYANSPVCSATRTALMTGRYQYRLRIGLEEPLLANRDDLGLPPDQPTLPSLLKKAGYATMLIGKWHLGPLPKFGPLQSGYDHFYGFRGGAVDYFTHAGSNKKEDLWDDETPVHQVGYLTEMLGARAVSAVNGYGRSKKPFFLSLHFSAPHWPWEVPGEEAESERLRTASLFHFDGGSQAIYRRMVEALDAEVGRVLAAVEANGLTQNTIIVFTSDNGGERFSNTWPFTGRKTELLEGGVRIPAIVSWPARVPQGKTTEQMAMSMDWMPTLLAAANAKPDPAFPFDGVNLLPVLAQNAALIDRKLFWRYKTNAQRAARDGDFKYLKILDNTFLFNVVEDPMERANLKDRRKDVFERLAGQWRAWNATMPPEVADSYTENFTGDQLPDHIGSAKAGTDVDKAD